MQAHQESASKRWEVATDDGHDNDRAHAQIVRMAISQTEHRAALRHSMIANAAYRRAQLRGFAPGHELEDWLNAELEVEAAQRSSVLCPPDGGTSVEHAARSHQQD
jgi:hypothetical protein